MEDLFSFDGQSVMSAEISGVAKGDGMPAGNQRAKARSPSSAASLRESAGIPEVKPDMTAKTGVPVRYHRTKHGRIIHGNSLVFLSKVRSGSVDLVMTSPPFGLVRKKDYGNVAADDYLEWFRPFALQISRVLKDTGSLVIDIGGAWNAGVPTRSLYHFKLLIMLCEEFGFHLAQDFYWWNPSKLPTPAEWVTVRRIRVKDAVNTVWWLSKSAWPKASNRRVLQPYSPSMMTLLANGYTAQKAALGT